MTAFVDQISEIIGTLTEPQLLTVKELIESQISKKHVSSIIEQYGYYISYNQLDSTIVDDLDLVTDCLSHHVDLKTYEHNKNPTWILSGHIGSTNNQSWTKYLFIHENLTDDASIEPESNRDKWYYGDWDDPVTCIGQVDVYIYHKPANDDIVYVIPRDTGMMQMVTANEIEEMDCECTILNVSGTVLKNDITQTEPSKIS